MAALKTVEAIYIQFQLNLDTMLLAAKSKEDHDCIMTRYVQAQSNYWSCINHAFHEEDPALQKLIADGQDVIAQLKTIDTQLGNIAKVIDIVTNAVHIGGAIVGKIIKL